jgi:hypothetical protein
MTPDGGQARPMACDDEVMRIVRAQSTPLFTAAGPGPCQVVRVTLAGGPLGGGGSAERRGRGKQSGGGSAERRGRD